MKKKWKHKINRKNKGLGVFGAIFIVLVAIVVANVFMVILTQNTLLTNAVKENIQYGVDRASEAVFVSQLTYSTDGSSVSVEVTLRNEGSVQIQLVTLWVFDVDLDSYGFNAEINEIINPGEERAFKDAASFVVELPGASSSDDFTAWFITARGVTIPLEKDKMEVLSVIHATTAKGIGSLVFDFDNFKYFTFKTPNQLEDYPHGTRTFNIPQNEYLAFGCYVSNFDVLNRTIVLDSHTVFWHAGSSGVAEKGWFIVNVDEDGNIEDTFTDVTFSYGETNLMVFASNTDVGTDGFFRLRSPQASGTIGVYLFLHGTLGGNPFGQTIPYVSMYYDPVS